MNFGKNDDSDFASDSSQSNVFESRDFKGGFQKKPEEIASSESGGLNA